jgi:hypothetical protein
MPKLHARSATIDMAHRFVGGLVHSVVGANTPGRRQKPQGRNKHITNSVYPPLKALSNVE